eukprot:m.230526 g.230526  ORF g.230526 m.230526 type:complete len:202 (-) comp19262_c0_seq8:184-789(-)
MHGPQEHTDTEGGPHTATRAILTDVQGTKFHNWDGQSMAGDNVVTLPPSVGTLLEQEVMPALVALLQSQPNGGTAWDFECQIEDMQSDSDEYDTRWSSIDVLVHVPTAAGQVVPAGKDSSPRLAARLHQRAVLNGLWRMGEADKHPVTPATPPMQAVLDAIDAALDMGEPDAFSEGDTAGAQRLQAGSSLAWHGYIMPLFL